MIVLLGLVLFVLTCFAIELRLVTFFMGWIYTTLSFMALYLNKMLGPDVEGVMWVYGILLVGIFIGGAGAKVFGR